MTAPLPTEPLLSTERLAVWAQERPLLDIELATAIIEAVSVLLRQYGKPEWDSATIPPRARDIGYIVAKDYYLNPRMLRQETTGPLQESVHDRALNGINLTEDQKAELAVLANGAPGAQVDGLWSLSITRGPVETHRENRHGSVIVYDTRGGWPIEYVDTSDVVIFTPEEPAP